MARKVGRCVGAVVLLALVGAAGPPAASASGLLDVAAKPAEPATRTATNAAAPVTDTATTAVEPVTRTATRAVEPVRRT